MMHPFKKMMNPFYRYTLTLLLISSIAISTITIFNINYTFKNEPGSEDTLAEAIKWQFRSRGVIATRVWQSNRLKNAQTEFALDTRKADTLILGSSSLMGVRDYMFPDERVVFNGAKNANSLSHAISEANYYIDRFKHLRWLLIGFDWGLGYPYTKSAIKPFDLDYENNVKTSILSKIKDAISHQRIKIVLANLKSELTYDDGPYDCPREDNVGKDIFRPPFPGTCYGSRYDGSATFSRYNGLSRSKWHALLESSGLQLYTGSLIRSKGVLNDEYLAELATINQVLKNRGGRLVIVIPAMMPQAARTIEQHEAGIYLKKTLVDLSTFAERNNLAVFDASHSEQFGCGYEEFLDPHHSFDTCYAKIFNYLYP